MLKIDFTNTLLKNIITNSVGNKQKEEGYSLSPELSIVKADSMDYLKKYFLSQFQCIEFFSFTHPVDLELNEMYVLVSNLFLDSNEFIAESHNFTKLLYEKSVHPKIKSGEINVVEFHDIGVNEELFDGLGIFKSESDVPYISMNKAEGSENYGIQHKYGYDLKGIDKGCLIINTNSESGYLILVVDKISGDAQYWVDDFLKVAPIATEFSDTKAFMDMTKKFLSEELNADNEYDNTEKIDLINKTVDFFKDNDRFEKQDFEESVLKDQKVIESFRNFAPTYSENHDVAISESFNISDQAVKKQVRKFKNILKLDKNFQIHISGDKSLIKKGVDDDGRKYYKIYYENEE